MREPLLIIPITSHLDSILRIFLKPLQPFQPHDANVRNERKMKEIGSLKKKLVRERIAGEQTGPRWQRWKTAENLCQCRWLEQRKLRPRKEAHVSCRAKRE